MRIEDAEQLATQWEEKARHRARRFCQEVETWRQAQQRIAELEADVEQARDAEQGIACLWEELRCASCNGTGQIGYDAGAPGALMYEDCQACDGSGVGDEALRSAEAERDALKERHLMEKSAVVSALDEVLEREKVLREALETIAGIEPIGSLLTQYKQAVQHTARAALAVSVSKKAS